MRLYSVWPVILRTWWLPNIPVVWGINAKSSNSHSLFWFLCGRMPSVHLRFSSHGSGSLHLSTLVTVSGFHCKCRSSTSIWKVTRSLATCLMTPVSQLHLRKKQSSGFILTSTTSKFIWGCSLDGELSWSKTLPKYLNNVLCVCNVCI